MNKKWTLIDTLIVVVIAAAAAVLWVMFGPSLTDKQTAQEVEFTVMIQDKEKGLADTMSVGDRVTLSLMEKDGGVIKDIRTEPSTVMVYDGLEGVYRNEINEEHEDIYVTVTADCTVGDKVIKTGDTKIRVGQEIPVRDKGYATNGFVIKIND